MKFQFEKFSFNKIIYFFSFTLILFTLACEAPQTTTTTTNQTVAGNAPVSTPSATPAQQNSASAAMPVTLPVLDAMFTDESFAGELKSKLQLTDEQIDRLKTTAREAVSNLSEEDSENAGSTRAAVERSSSRIREIVGEEKATQLFELVSRRWNGGDDAENARNAAGTRAAK